MCRVSETCVFVVLFNINASTSPLPTHKIRVSRPTGVSQPIYPNQCWNGNKTVRITSSSSTVHQIAKTTDNTKLRATNFSILLYLPLRPSCKIFEKNQTHIYHTVAVIYELSYHCVDCGFSTRTQFFIFLSFLLLKLRTYKKKKKKKKKKIQVSRTKSNSNSR
jgi:hypothetical protein